MPVLVARLGTQEITEPSEELRLSLVTLLSSLIELEGTRMAPYLSDLVTILQRTIVDPYPEVKKVSLLGLCIGTHHMYTVHVHTMRFNVVKPASAGP